MLLSDVRNQMDSSLILSNVINIMSASERFQRRNSVPTVSCLRHPILTTSFVITLSMLTVGLENMSVSFRNIYPEQL